MAMLAGLFGALGKYSAAQLAIPAALVAAGAGVAGVAGYRIINNSWGYTAGKQQLPSKIRGRAHEAARNSTKYMAFKYYLARDGYRDGVFRRNWDTNARIKHLQSLDRQANPVYTGRHAQSGKYDYIRAQSDRAKLLSDAKFQREAKDLDAARQKSRARSTWRRSNMNPFNWFNGKKTTQEPDVPRGPRGGHGGGQGAGGGGHNNPHNRSHHGSNPNRGSGRRRR